MTDSPINLISIEWAYVKKKLSIKLNSNQGKIQEKTIAKHVLKSVWVNCKTGLQAECKIEAY